MKILNPVNVWRFTVVSILAFTLVVSLGYPSHSLSFSSRSSIIDRTDARELNLDYLNEFRARPIADLAGSLIPAARNKVQSTSNVQVAIPIPSSVQSIAARSGIPNIDSRTRVRSSNGRTRSLGTRPGRYNVIANRNPSGRLEPITPTSLDSMFAVEERNGGFISPANRRRASRTNRRAQSVSHLVADASGKYAQTEDYFTIDLLAVDNDTGKYVEIKGVEADSFCIDAIYAVRDDEWIVNE
jgi:hypothetical protein